MKVSQKKAAGAEVPAVFRRPVRLEVLDVPTRPAPPSVMLPVYALIYRAFLAHGLSLQNFLYGAELFDGIAAYFVPASGNPHPLFQFLTFLVLAYSILRRKQETR